MQDGGSHPPKADSTILIFAVCHLTVPVVLHLREKSKIRSQRSKRHIKTQNGLRLTDEETLLPDMLSGAAGQARVVQASLVFSLQFCSSIFDV
jgi:hypothetical protein